MASDQIQNTGLSGEKMLPDNVGNPLPATEFQQPFREWQEAEEVQLRDYLEVVMRRKWLIATVLTLVFLSTLIFSLAVTRIYEASAVVEVSQETPHVTTFQEVLGSEIQAREFYETQVELLRSKAMINRVIKELDLVAHPVIRKTVFSDGKPGFLGRIAGAVKSLVGSMFQGQAKPVVDAEITMRQQVAEFVSKNLTITPSRKSMLIDVAFRSPDRQLSQAVVNTLIEDFIRWKMELKVDASGIARDFLMMQMDRAKINLEKAEERLNEFAKHAGIVSLDARINSIYRHLEELSSAYAEAEADMITKTATYQQAVKDGHANLPRVLESNLIASLKDKYADLNAEHEELKATFHDDYPRVKTLKARMDSIAALIEAQEKGIFQSIENEYESSRKVASAMEKRIAHQKSLVLDLNDRATQYSIMAREVDTNKEIYQSLLQRAKEIESMAGVSSSNIQIVNRADLPLVPIKPNVKLNLLLSIVLGLLGGIGCAFLAEYFADTVIHPNEISDRFRIPLLGTIPQSKPDANGLESAFTRHPRSSFSEAIRSTRVSVQLSGSGLLQVLSDYQHPAQRRQNHAGCQPGLEFCRRW
jgi:succinoglycan biosynthesis transport protein ExoP